MSSQITGGSVTYGRTVQPQQYCSNKAEVVLTFSVEEGDADYIAWLNLAAAQAHGKVHEMLGLKSAKPEAPAGAEGLKLPETPTAEAKKRTSKPKPVSEADALDPPMQVAPANGSTAPVTETPAPAVLAAVEVDPFGVDVAAPKTITDTELQETIAAANAGGVKTGPIKELIGKYATPQTVGLTRSVHIPQEKRAAFLLELKALPK